MSLLLSISIILFSGGYSTIITDEFNDDYLQDNAAVNGWYIYDDHTGSKGNPLVHSANTGITYHGPTKRDTNQGYYQRKFKCAQHSRVRWQAHIAYCSPSSSTSNTIHTFFNGEDYGNVFGWVSMGTGTTYKDPALVTATGCNNWETKQIIEPNSNIDSGVAPIVNANQEFDFKFKFRLIGGGDYAVVWNFKLFCDSVPTPTHDPTISPTTREPTTRSPTSKPTPSPTDITLHPTISPTTRAPTTRSPTMNPTPSPVDDPTRSPTTREPTTHNPTTHNPTIYISTTGIATTYNPTTSTPTLKPITYSISIPSTTDATSYKLTLRLFAYSTISTSNIYTNPSTTRIIKDNGIGINKEGAEDGNNMMVTFIIIGVSVIILTLIICCLIRASKSKIKDHPSRFEFDEEQRNGASNKQKPDLFSVKSGSKSKPELFAANSLSNANRKKCSDPALQQEFNREFNEVGIEMANYNTPGSLIDGHMMDLEVDSFQENDNGDILIINPNKDKVVCNTCGPFIKMDTNNEPEGHDDIIITRGRQTM